MGSTKNIAQMGDAWSLRLSARIQRFSMVLYLLLQYIWNRIWQPVIFHSSSFLSYNKRVIG